MSNKVFYLTAFLLRYKAASEHYRHAGELIVRNSCIVSGVLIFIALGLIPNRSFPKSDPTNSYLDSGYIDAIVTPQITLDRENKTTTVVYNVDERELKYVREIRVTGNDITKDEIVRRQMLLIPGERYDGTAVKESEKRIQNTRFFDKVRVTLDDTDDELFTDLLMSRLIPRSQN